MEIKVGDKFGSIVVVGEYESRNGRKWPCVCSCGNGNVVWRSVTDLRRKAEVNGGCEKCATGPVTHGYGSSRNPTYSKYQAMKQRCTNSKHRDYHSYGGRGIKVCERWMNSFEAFLEDMGECPKDMSIDRIEVDGNYEPGNCRWATKEIQSKNTRKCIKAVIDGVEYLTLKDAALAFGISYSIAKARVSKYGWDIETALKTPPGARLNQLPKELTV